MWRPTASIEKLKTRARIIAKIRAFFYARDVFEVETPLLSHSTNPDPNLQSFKVENLYLQTSPEFAMKRLLAAGSGDIYQICKAFRGGEAGCFHNPEFTILEWYRINFDHHALMDEIDELLQFLLQTPQAERLTYQNLFWHFLSLNPHAATLQELKNCAANNNINVSDLGTDRDAWLQLLLTHLIEPKLTTNRPLFVYDFPQTQAMLARLNAQNLAERFEVYFQGIELANGFHELSNASEQRLRFEKNLKDRHLLHLPQTPLDENFLNALSTLPNCSGVAMGIDRLVLLATKAGSIDDVLSFTIKNA